MMTMKVSCRRIAVVGLAVGLMYQLPLSGQPESQDPHLRNDCRFAGQILQTGQPSPHYDWALGAIRLCSETGGEVLASLWSRPPTDSATLNKLFLASYTVRDARITNAAITAVLNESLPQLVRLNAMRVLVGHAVPRFRVSLADLSPDTPAHVTRMLPGVSHVVVKDGASPVGPEEIDSILEVLSRLRTDPDARLAAAAVYVHRQLSLWLQNGDGR
jgi:hypothetical protein